jgi:REP element-mobilizing transposase RayT
VPRTPRSALPPFAIFHAVNRGANHCEIYRDDADRKTFLTMLGRVVHEWEWTCHAYCLMTTHYHLIVETENPRLSSGMQRLHSRYAMYFNRRHDRDGHLWGGRYTVYVIEDGERLEASCLYVLDNPVRAGLCAKPEDWRWSARFQGQTPGRVQGSDPKSA